MRVLLNGVYAFIAAVFFVRISAINVVRAVTFKSASFGVYAVCEDKIV